MRIAVLTETDPIEPRVAAVPETVKKFIGLGSDVVVQSGAGAKAGVPDGEYEAAGAKIAGSADEHVSAGPGTQQLARSGPCPPPTVSIRLLAT